MEEPATNPDNDQKRLEQIGQHRFQGSSTRIYVIAFTAMALFLVAPAAWLVLQTFSADATLARRLLLLSMAAFLLALPGRVAWVVLRRRRRTGHWSLRLSHEERLQLAAKWGRPFARG
jgi:hypothetical protein